MPAEVGSPSKAKRHRARSITSILVPLAIVIVVTLRESGATNTSKGLTTDTTGAPLLVIVVVLDVTRTSLI